MESYSEVFDMVKEYCKGKVTDTVYKLWLEPINMLSFEDNKVVLTASDFKANIIRSKFMDLLREAFEETMGFPIEVTITGENTAESETRTKTFTKSDDINLTYEPTFDNFVVSNSNKFAHAAAIAVSKTPGTAYNPLFIYGNSGLGKTHLLNAIYVELRNNNPDLKIIYIRSEDFTNELIHSIERNAMTQFHNKYRSADVLLMDDIHFIAGKTQTQEEFFHTFNYMHEEKKQIVLTSDRPPKDIALLEDRIKTRFEWGLLADIQPPDLETRMAIIKQKSKELSINLPEDVVQYIAEKIKSNVRQLEGAVKKIKALCTIGGYEPTIAVAQKAINDIMTDNQPVGVTVDKIINEVARTFGVSVDDILSEKRNDEVSKARQAAMYIIHDVTSLSTEKIGEKFGGKHHSTAIYSIKKCKDDMKENPSLKATINNIINNINENNSDF